MWPIIAWPSAVAAPVAANAEQCDSGSWRGPFCRFPEDLTFQTGPGGVEGLVHEGTFDLGIDRDDVEEVDRPALDLGTGRGGSIGDALHFFEQLAIILPEKEGIGQVTQFLPSVGRRLGGPVAAQVADVVGDFPTQKPAMLVASVIRLALNMQDSPAVLRIEVSRALAPDRGGV